MSSNWVTLDTICGDLVDALIEVFKKDGDPAQLKAALAEYASIFLSAEEIGHKESIKSDENFISYVFKYRIEYPGQKYSAPLEIEIEAATVEDAKDVFNREHASSMTQRFNIIDIKGRK